MPKFFQNPSLACVVFAFCGVVLSSPFARAEFDLKCYLKDNCNGKSTPGSVTGNPSTGSQVKINPSAVPTAAGYGIEGIFFKDSIDFAIVRGTGRVGAAISPSNSEETFFGPPGFENPQDLFNRKRLAEKFPNQKITLAAAMDVYDNRKSGLKAFSLKLGAMGKYNKTTKSVTPGGGLNGVLGPLIFGGSIYRDQTQVENSYDNTIPGTRINYQVQTYNIGLFLSSLILDYSHLKVQIDDAPDVTSSVTLLTATLLVDKFIITGSKRIEESSGPSYNYETQQLEYVEIKENYFGGVQYAINKHFMAGVFYNYYLLRDFSISATFFF